MTLNRQKEAFKEMTMNFSQKSCNLSSLFYRIMVVLVHSFAMPSGAGGKERKTAPVSFYLCV
jgi:hypothetical protein